MLLLIIIAMVVMLIIMIIMTFLPFDVHCTDDSADDDDDISADASSYTETVAELKQRRVSVVATDGYQATLRRH